MIRSGGDKAGSRNDTVSFINDTVSGIIHSFGNDTVSFFEIQIFLLTLYIKLNFIHPVNRISCSRRQNIIIFRPFCIEK